MMSTNSNVWAFPEAICPHCASCSKPIGVYQCIGCGKIFCSQHTASHRQMLRGELHEIIHESEQWNAYWNDETRKRQKVLKTKQENVFEQIEDWERQAITKIKQASAEAREQSKRLFEHHINMIPKWTALDISALKRAMETDGFVETHLSRWKIQLKRLKGKVSAFVTDFIRLKVVEPFISKLVVDGEYTPYEITDTNDDLDPEILIPPVHLMVPIEGDFTPYNEGELKTGVHQFRYKSKCIFFGVASKKANISKDPWNTPSTYGWTGDDVVYLNANPVQGYDGYQSNLELGDTYLLTVDCDRRTIRLKNERTNDSHVLDVDPTKCPLPWQLNVRFLDHVQP
ncbi:hypothetical protein I4U23_023244 [Adineta vaga]|nr:hypothetical protein I4U23_023244 [Adineta vaga]